MRITRYGILAAALAVLLLSPGCKKKNATVTIPPLDGSLYFQIKPYYRAGDEVTLRPKGLSHPDGKGIGYWWLVDLVDGTVRDTVKLQDEDADPVKSFVIGDDKFGEFKATCGSFATGYTNSTYEKTFYVINPLLGETITDLGIEKDDPHITAESERAGEGDYYTVENGRLTWMRNNLANTSCGAAFYDCEVMSYPLGRFYTWEEARTACPDGWRLPTDEEWAALGTVAGDLMADAYALEDKMWEYWPQVKITNAKGLSAIPSGYAVLGNHHQFSGFMDYAVFWTASSDPEDDTKALCRTINVNEPEVYVGSHDKATFGASVRCVK